MLVAVPNVNVPSYYGGATMKRLVFNIFVFFSLFFIISLAVFLVFPDAPATASTLTNPAPVSVCAGDRLEDGTILINASFCSNKKGVVENKCNVWLRQSIKSLKGVLRNTECSPESDNDIGDCMHLSIVQIICKADDRSADE